MKDLEIKISKGISEVNIFDPDSKYQIIDSICIVVINLNKNTFYFYFHISRNFDFIENINEVGCENSDKKDDQYY